MAGAFPEEVPARGSLFIEAIITTLTGIIFVQMLHTNPAVKFTQNVSI